MIRIHEIKLNALEQTDALPAKIEHRLHLPAGNLESFCIVKESVDARQKPKVYKIYSVDISAKIGDEKLTQLCKRAGIRCEAASTPKFEILPLQDHSRPRPVVVGFGPCGIFAALTLAKAGARPIVLERGASMEGRIAAVEHFMATGELDLHSNIQFGEGGAGTFSDGKLTTGTKSPYQRFVLEEFVKAGAAEEILYKQKPHIGTDVLRKVVVNLRKEIEALGGEFFFDTALTWVEIKDGKVCGIFAECRQPAAASEDESGHPLTRQLRIETDAVILALGHSARDTVRSLYEEGLDMQQKQFSMGVRIEHPQRLVDLAQYGAPAEKLGLEPADYKLNVRTKEGRGVYTFCMCPGGEVINASSHEGCTVTNGMSNFRRDSGKANSALLADVRPSDFGSDHPLAGMAFQEKYEHLAYLAGGSNYTLPKENLKAFLDGGILKTCLPDFVYASLKEAVPMLGRKLKGFDNPNAMLYGIESRSSSPVRMVRDEDGFAQAGGSPIRGLYPAGEGAGYAGGIMSASCDGVRTAMKILDR